MISHSDESVRLAECLVDNHNSANATFPFAECDTLNVLLRQFFQTPSSLVGA